MALLARVNSWRQTLLLYEENDGTFGGKTALFDGLGAHREASALKEALIAVAHSLRSHGLRSH